MLDRVPVNPGRVLVTPENGSAAFYATLTRADNPTQEGNPLNKATFFKDATAALFGLGSAGVPDEAFAILGKYNQHWWKRRPVKWVESLGSANSNVYFVYASDKTTSCTSYYSSSISIDAEGNVSLVNPTTLTATYNSYSDASNLAVGMYVADCRTGSIYKLTSTSKSNGTTGAYTRYFYYGQKVTATTEVLGDWEYVQSADRNAYPDLGCNGSYEYVYMGVPFGNAVTAPKIASGTYTGAGTTDSVSLTFDFVPKLIFVFSSVAVTGSSYSQYVVFPGMGGFGVTEEPNDVATYAVTLGKGSVDGTTVTFVGSSIYNVNAAVEYNYVAIG